MKVYVIMQNDYPIAVYDGPDVEKFMEEKRLEMFKRQIYHTNFIDFRNYVHIRAYPFETGVSNDHQALWGAWAEEAIGSYKYGDAKAFMDFLIKKGVLK